MKQLQIILSIIQFNQSEDNSNYISDNNNSEQIKTNDVNPSSTNIESKQDFVNMTQLNWIGIILSFIGFNMSMAGGLGGGGIAVPINVLFFNCSFTHAVALSKISIFSGSLVRWISEINARSPHNYEDKPLVDYQTSMLFEPVILAGTVLGVILNIWFPEYILLILLVFTLAFNTWKVADKGYHLQVSETRKDLVQIKKEIEMNKISNPLINNTPNSDNQLIIASEDLKHQFEAVQNSQKGIIAWDKFGLIVISFILLCSQSQLRGDQKTSNFEGITFCSPLSWTILVAQLFLNLVLVYISYRITKNEQYLYIANNKQVNYEWTTQNQSMFTIVVFIAGILAGSLGIAGGLLMGPILLEMGIDPRVSTATSNFMGLFTSFSTSFQYWLLGKLVKSLAWKFMLISALASFTGNQIVKQFVEKQNKRYIIVFILTIVLACSTISLPQVTWNRVQGLYVSGQDIWNFRNFC